MASHLQDRDREEVRKSRITEGVLEFILKFFLRSNALLARVLPFSALTWLGRALGDFAYVIWPHRRALVRFNLSFALGDKARWLAREVFRNLGIGLVEFLALPRYYSSLRRICLVRGKRFLDEALRKGKGVILLSAHIGNWEMIPAKLTLEGYKVFSVVRPQEILEGEIRKIRGRMGWEAIPAEVGMLTLLHKLKKGGIVGILMDQAVLSGAVWVPFFGKLAPTPAGVAILALRSSAEVLPIYDIRKGRRHVVTIEPAVEITRTGDFRRDVIENTRRLNQIIERWIRENPDQWFWVHKRWRKLERSAISR